MGGGLLSGNVVQVMAYFTFEDQWKNYFKRRGKSTPPPPKKKAVEYTDRHKSNGEGKNK